MQYQVPQFIDLEPKIIGPLTIKQVMYLAVAGGSGFFLWILHLDILVFLLLSIAIIAPCFVLAFVRVNGRPFSTFLFSLFNFAFAGKVFVWQQREQKIQKKQKVEEKFIKPVSEPLRRGESEVEKLNRRIALGA